MQSELHDVRTAATRTSNALPGLNRNVGDLIKNFGALVIAGASVRGAITLIGSSSANAGIIQGSRNIGVQTKLIQDLDKAYQGQLTTLQKYQVASQAALRGVSGERLTRTATIANQLSDAGYGDAVALTDQITSAFETGRIKGLAPYIVDFQNLNEKVREGVVSQEQLLDILQKNASRLGDINADEAADQLGRINAQFADMKQYAGEQLGIVFTPILKGIADVAAAWNNLDPSFKNIILGGVGVLGATGVGAVAVGAAGNAWTWLKEGALALGLWSTAASTAKSNLSTIQNVVDINKKYGVAIGDVAKEIAKMNDFNLSAAQGVRGFNSILDEHLEKLDDLVAAHGNVGVSTQNTQRSLVNSIPVWGQVAIAVGVATAALWEFKWINDELNKAGMGPQGSGTFGSSDPSIAAKNDRTGLLNRAKELQVRVIPHYGDVLNPAGLFNQYASMSNEELYNSIIAKEMDMGIPMKQRYGYTESKSAVPEGFYQHGSPTEIMSRTPQITESPNSPRGGGGGSAPVSGGYGVDNPGDFSKTMSDLYNTGSILFGEKAAMRRFKAYNTPDQFRIDSHNRAVAIRARNRTSSEVMIENTLKPLAKAYDAMFGSGRERRINEANQAQYDFNLSLMGLHGQEKIDALLGADPALLGADEARHKHNVGRKMAARNTAMQAVGDIASGAINGGARGAAVSALQTGLSLIAANNPMLAIPLGIISGLVPGLFAPHQRKTIPGPTDVRIINPEEIAGPIQSAIQQFMRLTSRGVAAGGRQFVDQRLAMQSVGVRGF